ncbi:Amuc_1100 family pilus-like protein [Geminisphaera colitermitum]|uniref:Amuc_1100 family pilus-like protein n=1 Tax=Geminisphaera colitermitum TaxID=1148786 RepID=UPI0001965090|nr:Amuc_1100 family pilus-like protein [Geminisphaera colitermitum]
MAKFKTHPVFYSSLAVLFLAAAGAATLLVTLRSTNATSQEQIKQREDTLQGFARKNPFPSQENARLVEEDLQRMTQLLATYQQELRGRGSAAGKILTAIPPATSTEAYFQFAQFVETMRVAAQTAGVAIPPGFRFGFASYNTNGPEEALIPVVFRQRLITEHLLTTLFAANTTEQPIELVGYHRERPVAPSAPGADGAAAPPPPASGSGGGDGGDFFDIDPRISARVPNFVDATAFRLTFVGYTSALRTFLNQLATFEVPVVVRSVEIVPAGAEKPGGPGGGSPPPPPRPQARPQGFGGIFGTTTEEKTKENEPQPLVQPGRSRFTITVEFINLVATPTNAGAAPAAQPQPES